MRGPRRYEGGVQPYAPPPARNSSRIDPFEAWWGVCEAVSELRDDEIEKARADGKSDSEIQAIRDGWARHFPQPPKSGSR